MERQLWIAIVTLLEEVNKSKYDPRCAYTVAVIVKVWFWAAIHDRPVCWACDARNWPIWERRQRLPSNTTMSRRLRSPAVKKVIKAMEDRALRPHGPCDKGNMVWMIDGKPLTISGCSKDRQAGYGHAAGCKARGYKIHAIVGSNRTVAHWRLAPMNKDERVMASRMLKDTKIHGYLLADCNYDANKLHELCDRRQNLQLVSPRRSGAGKGLGHRKHAAGRIRSKDILEDPFAEFGQQLLQQRKEIERYYGNLTNWGGGLNCLPSWARTHQRAHRWVQAKFIINAVKRSNQPTTYVN